MYIQIKRTPPHMDMPPFPFCLLCVCVCVCVCVCLLRYMLYSNIAKRQERNSIASPTHDKGPPSLSRAAVLSLPECRAAPSLLRSCHCSSSYRPTPDCQHHASADKPPAGWCLLLPGFLVVANLPSCNIGRSQLAELQYTAKKQHTAQRCTLHSEIQPPTRSGSGRAPVVNTLDCRP